MDTDQSSIIRGQGESLQVQSQDESDTPEEISAAIATLRFWTPELELTGKLICQEESGRQQGNPGHSDDGGLSAPSNQTGIGPTQVDGRFI